MNRERAENYVFIGSIILAAVLVALIFLPELDAIVLGITFAVLFQPLYGWLKRKMPHEQGAAALLIVLLTILIVFTPLVFIGYQLFGEASGLYVSISSGHGVPAVTFIETRLLAADPAVAVEVHSYLQQFFGWIASSAGTVVSGIAGAFFAIFLSFFALYYFLKDGEDLHEAVLERSPLPREDTAKLIARLHIVMSSIIRGSLLIAAFYGIVVGVGFFVFGLPSGIFWGVVTAFASFIPMIGTYLVIVPGMIALALAGHYWAAVGLFAWCAIASVVMENYLRPLLIGKKADIHPLLIVFSVVGGLSFFGPLGVLLGPLSLGVLLALLDIYPVLADRK